MKRISLLIVAASALAVWGCGSSGQSVVVGPDGSKVTTDGAGNSTFTGPNGEKVQVNSDGSMTATDKDGKTTTAKVDKDGKSFSATNDKGESFSMSADAVTESDLGVPFYPGSEAGDGSSKVSSNDKTVVMSSRTTSDEPEKVVAFYKDKITEPKDMNFEADGSKTCALSGKLGGKDFSVTAVKSKDDPKTKISLAVSDH